MNRDFGYIILITILYNWFISDVLVDLAQAKAILFNQIHKWLETKNLSQTRFVKDFESFKGV